MKIELLGGTSREHLEERMKVISTAARLSHFSGNVLELLDESKGFDEDVRFIKKIIGRGHKSVIEHDYLIFALVDVTPIIEQIIIGARLTAFTIKSRRYVDFREAGFYIPDFRNTEYSLHMENKEFKAKYRKHMRFLFKEYGAMLDGGIPAEDARFILPYSFYSNIIMSLDARELEKLINYLMYGEYSKIQEVYELGVKLCAIAKKQLPYLASSFEKYVRKSIRYDYRSMLEKYKPKGMDILKKPVLLDYTVSPDDTVLEYAVMYETQCGYDEARKIIEEAEKEDSDFKEKMMDAIVHKEENRELEQVSFNFQIPISLSVLTHLTRHRMHSLLVPNFVPLWNFNNYIIPETIKNSKFADKYKKIVETNMKVLEEFKNAGIVEEDLVYFYLGAQMCNVVTTMNARSLMWISRMRCCNRAQWQIRNIANIMVGEVKKIAPLIGKGLGPSCVVDHICNEGGASCGLIKKILEKENA